MYRRKRALALPQILESTTLHCLNVRVNHKINSI